MQLDLLEYFCWFIVTTVQLFCTFQKTIADTFPSFLPFISSHPPLHFAGIRLCTLDSTSHHYVIRHSATFLHFYTQIGI